ncbi:preprotein translocase subunit SecG [Tranquillimonas rosea]|uniref:Protein-export membrane protein SecG n=1 Tax=Tranquillimonas rosea TaxID=641238 RepID=A0A1H9WDR2_9RHOB|nr:preprotein translocase subunit SecG [Tranquillimonas rosea]SES31931.1 preprotein translocase subunit SecG [Tranquillimonas rosea]
MENVVLIIHLILALSLIGVVLLQRSEGGGLGMGGGGGGGVMSSRGAATALGKLTWAFAIAFIATSLTLTIFAAQDSTGSSVVDRLGVPAPAAEDGAETGGQQAPADDLLPPGSGGGEGGSDAPLAPPRAD